MKHKSPIMQILYPVPETRREFPSSEEYHRRLNVVVDLDDALRKRLSTIPDLDSLYTETNNAIEYMHLQELDECFAEAFRLGFLLALDIVEYEPK